MKLANITAIRLAGVIAASALAAGAARAQEPYKIGISAGLSGYAATVDRAWSDGVQTAVDVVNASGGVLGHKLTVIVEDNRSEPQDAVTVYRKMISSDQVNVFISGCVSAGNMAAAPQVVRAEIPMVLCSILPRTASDVKWAFTTLPPPRFEIETRLRYLKDKTSVRKIAVLHDPSPYAILQKDVAVAIAKDYGIEIVGVEQYKTNDADLSVVIAKMNSAGAGAIIKIGLGGTTLTAAKNIKALGLNSMLLLTSLEDLAVFRPVAEVLGDRFFFVASPSQVYEALPDSPLKAEIGKFLTPWKQKFADRDPNWASRGWDAVMLTVDAIKKGGSIKGASVRDQLEKITNYQGTTGVYNFSAENHQGITTNPFVLGQIIDGKVKVAQ